MNFIAQVFWPCLKHSLLLHQVMILPDAINNITGIHKPLPFWGMAIRLEHNNDVLMNSVTINLHGRFGADKLPVQWRVEKNYTKMFVGAKYNFMA